jgi:maltooligosyltrehalose trehalohydrolase
MLFQGQEFAATTRFSYFADHNPELRKLVREGRQKFLHQFRSIACAECTAELAEPGDRATFESSKLDFADRERNRPIYRLHGDLLRLRREDPTIATPARIDGAVLSERAFVIRYFVATDARDRLLLVNLGSDLHLPSVAEPLLAPVRSGGWKIAWSSESPEYGGNGTPDLETTAGWILPARSAVLLEPYERSELPNAKLSEVD